jgi:DNA repair exonuclease SbcCD ATPase subunit
MQQELDTLRTELATLRTSLTQVGGASRAASEARAQLEAEVERLRVRIPPLETELAQLRETQPELAQLRTHMPEVQAALSTAQAQVTTLTAAEKELKRQVLDFDVALAQARAQAAELEGAKVDVSVSQVELESELRAHRDRANLAEAEATRLREARLLETEANSELFNRNALLEAQLTEASRAAPQSSEDVAQVRRRLPELEAELEILRVNSKNDVDAAQAARQQVEELLLALRVKYGDLQHHLTTATEDLAESKAENELLDSERERLAQEVETLEAGKGRIAQLEHELEVLRSALARPIVPPLVEKPVEVFELDVEEDNGDVAEEIVLLEDEATDPGKKDPRKP